MSEGSGLPRVSTIVLNWNGRAYLSACLSALQKVEYDNLEILVVDNGSTDGSVDLIRQQFPSAHLVICRENVGSSTARNRAATLAEGKYLLFLDNDTQIDPACIRELVQAAENRPSVGIWGCLQRSYDGQHELSCGLGCDPLGYPIYQPDVKVFYADLSSLFIRRRLFEQLEGLDPHYFIFHEEVDLCWRAQLLGYQVSSVHSALVRHASGGSAVGGYARPGVRHRTTAWRRYLTKRNQARTLLKNYSWPVLALVLPVAVCVDLAGMLALIASGQPRAARDSYLKAWADNIRALPLLLEQRRAVQKSRRVSDREILRNMTWAFGEWSAFRQTGMPDFGS